MTGIDVAARLGATQATAALSRDALDIFEALDEVPLVVVRASSEPSRFLGRTVETVDEFATRSRLRQHDEALRGVRQLLDAVPVDALDSSDASLVSAAKRQITAAQGMAASAGAAPSKAEGWFTWVSFHSDKARHDLQNLEFRTQNPEWGAARHDVIAARIATIHEAQLAATAAAREVLESAPLAPGIEPRVARELLSTPTR